MKLISLNNYVLSNILFCSLFLGCGSDDDSVTPSTNTPPIVSIVGENTIQERQSLTLTANASDTDGTINSVKWSTTSTDISLTGVDTATVSFTAPDVDSDRSVTLDVLVTDNEGATTTQSISITIMRKEFSLTLTGLVTDNKISNADVEITIGGQIFSATADTNGVYTITITVDESLINQLVQLRALGDSSINPEVEFVSQLGSLTSLIEQAGSDGNLQKEENFGVNITNVTTAEYALFTRDGHTPTTDSELNSAMSSVNSDEKNTLAALIKIVVDNGNFSLPSGVTSTLDLVSDSATATAFEQDIIAQNPTLITENISSIVNDNSLTVESDIVGTWKVGSDVITFTRSGHYIHITTEVEDGSDQKLGYEIGSYSWSKSTGALSFITTEDSNGGSGLHDEFTELLNTKIVDAGNFTVVGDTLTIVEGDDTYNASRLASDSNPLVGGFYQEKTNFSDDFSIDFTIDDSKLFFVSSLSDTTSLPAGLSYSFGVIEYSYDAESALRILHSISIYADGDLVVEIPQELSRHLVNVQGDVISFTTEYSNSFIKNSYTSTTQDYLTDDDIMGNFNGAIGDGFTFNATFNADGTGQASEFSIKNWQVVFGQLLITEEDGATSIWSPTAVADDVWQFNVTQYSDAGEFDSSFSGTLTPSENVISAPTESSIFGTWTATESVGRMFSVTFASDGHYVHMEEDDPLDNCDSSGFEVGTYTWNETTGVVTVTTSEDTNGCVGLHDLQPLNVPFEFAETIKIVGESMTITSPSGVTSHFNRIISDTNPIVGAYLEGDFENEFFLIVFEENGTFMELAHDSDELGLTAGTYSWDPSSTLFDFTSLTINQWGYNPDQNIISAQGDILFWKDAEDAGVMKRTHQSSEQPYLTDTNQVIGSFTGTSDDNFGFQATLYSDFTGVNTDDSGTYGFEWSINFGQLIVDYGDEIVFLSPTAISPNILEFSVTDFDLIDTLNGNEIGQVEYYLNTWTRN